MYCYQRKDANKRFECRPPIGYHGFEIGQSNGCKNAGQTFCKENCLHNTLYLSLQRFNFPTYPIDRGLIANGQLLHFYRLSMLV